MAAMNLKITIKSDNVLEKVVFQTKLKQQKVCNSAEKNMYIVLNRYIGESKRSEQIPWFVIHNTY